MRTPHLFRIAADREFLDWLRANGIVPADLPMRGSELAIDTTGRWITYMQVVRNTAGRMEFDGDKMRTKPARVALTVAPSPRVAQLLAALPRSEAEWCRREDAHRARVGAAVRAVPAVAFQPPLLSGGVL